MRQIHINCPTCHKKFNYFSSSFRPFCTERCRLIDLGQWLNESYTVPVEKLTDDQQQKLEDLNYEKQKSENEDY